VLSSSARPSVVRLTVIYYNAVTRLDSSIAPTAAAVRQMSARRTVTHCRLTVSASACLLIAVHGFVTIPTLLSCL